MAVNDIVMGAAGASGLATYVEDVFSTYLYTGTGASQTITNGMDLSGKGGLVWMKGRSGATDHALYDTTRGATFDLASNTTAVQTTQVTGVTSFNSSGFVIGALAKINTSAATYASWSFRKQPKFFDIVTWTGNGDTQSIAHNLGSTPGFIIVKKYARTSVFATSNWAVWHRSQSTKYAYLNTAGLFETASAATMFGNNTTVVAPTSTTFTVGGSGEVNTSGDTYVAYLFAHNAGGFGATGTDNVISCGTYTGNGSTAGPTVSLGYEPQYLMIKNATATGSWQIIDNMRGMPVGIADATLQANLSVAETSVDYVSPNATGFQITSTSAEVNTNAATYIYIAIRRPMKTPTTGTSVFSPVARTGTGTNATVTGGSSPTDLAIIKSRTAAQVPLWTPRLAGTGYLDSASNAAEIAAGATILQTNPWDVMNGVKVGTTSAITNSGAYDYINYLFTRAAGFMDAVCYTGTGTAGQTYNHNLGVIPEMMIIKKRSTPGDWPVYHSGVNNGVNPENYHLFINAGNSQATDSNYYWYQTKPTSTVFTLGIIANANQASATYIAYLFATVAGVSKVGKYIGNGSSQTINCSFTTGARFVLIKRTDSVGDWYVWDSARGIVAGNDPRFVLNGASVEVTTDDSVDADSSGFIVNQLAATNINVNAASYIFLAIA